MTLFRVGGRWRVDSRRTAVALVAAGIVVGVARWNATPPDPLPPTTRPLAAAEFIGTPPPAVTPSPASAKREFAPPAMLPRPVGGTREMKEFFDDNIGSVDPRQRRVAARAFDTCVPAFLPRHGEMPSPETLIRALPQERRAEREAAYRQLYDRCASLLRESRESLLGVRQQLQGDPALHEPGLRAQQKLIDGRLERIEPLVSRALAGDDPAGVASLAGLAARLARLRDPENESPDLMQKARAVDAALPWVACDLGLDCSADSAGALQLCAVQSLCDGDMLSRLMVPAVAEGIDSAAIQAQHARLLPLIRSGRALGIADLLP